MRLTLLRHRSSAQDTALAIGNFDGIHLGHQRLLQHMVAQGQVWGLLPTVLTFTPHPREFFAQQWQRPSLTPTRILNLRDKLQGLWDCGVRQVALRRFDASLAHLSPTAFIEDMLCRQLRVRYLYVGRDFAFGHGRQGTVETLAQAAKVYGFHLEVMSDQLDAQTQRYSSTALRKALALGNLTQAAELMGRLYHISGRVIHGQKLGRTIGVPTLNIPMMPHAALRSGVYVVSVEGLTPQALPAVASVGVRPTVDNSGKVLLEVHILNHNVQAYGKMVKVRFHHFIRDEEKFPDLTTLCAAISQDIAVAHRYFQDYGL